ESVVIGNITRVVENLCHDELQLLNRGIGHLLGQPDIETSANPFAPAAIIAAFSEALKTVKAEHRVKYTILKELNQASLAEINSIYSDLNKHLQNLHVMPAGARRLAPLRRAGGAHRDSAAGTHAEDADASSAKVDVMALFQKRFGGPPVPPQMPPGMQAGFPVGMPGPPGHMMADGSQEF